MESSKPSDSHESAAIEALPQPSRDSSTETQSGEDASVCSEVSPGPTLADVHNHSKISSRTSKSSKKTSLSKKSISSRTSLPSGTSVDTEQWCLLLMVEMYPPRQVTCRKNVSEEHKATQTPSSFNLSPTEWLLWNKKEKKQKARSESQDQPQQQVSVVSNIKGSTSRTSQPRAASIPRMAVTTQDSRKKMSSVSVRQYSEVGGKQDEAMLEPEGKWDSAGEVKPQLLPEEIHLADQNQLSSEEIHSPDQNQLSPEEIHFPDQDQLPPKATHLPDQHQQEALEDVAVDDTPGDIADIHAADFKTGTIEVSSASKELPEDLQHITERTDIEKNLISDRATVVNSFVSEPEDLLCLAAVDDASLAAPSLSLSKPDIFMENQALLLARCPTPPKYSPDPTLGYKDDTQDIDSILESITSKVLTSSENLENSGRMGEDKVGAISDGSILSIPEIHTDLKELKKAKVNERASASPIWTSKTSAVTKPVPMKRVVKPLPKKPVRDLSRSPQQKTECKAAKNMTRKQQGDRPLDLSDSPDGATDKKCFTETISSWKTHPSNLSSASDRGMLFLEVFLKLVELAALPQKTLFEIISHYQRKLRDQKNQMDDDGFKCGRKIWKEVVYPTTSSFASTAHDLAGNKKKAAAHTKSHKGSPYAQVPIFPRPKQDSAILRKPRKSLQKAVKNAQSALFDTRCFCERKQMQKKAQAAKRCRQSPALFQQSSLLKLWHKISEDHTDSRLFHHTACTCSSLWNAGQDPEADTDFCRPCYLSARRRRAKQRATMDVKLRSRLNDSTTGR